MDLLINKYEYLEERILRSLKSNGIEHRPKASSGLWVGVLVGLCAVLTFMREDSSYSEICLVTGVTGFGLLISCICLYLSLSMEKIAVKDFQVVYFLPAIITSMLYLLIVNKGLILSVIWGVSVGSLSTWGVLQLMSTFPRCFTIGEATSVMHGFTLFLISALTNLPLRYHLPPIHDGDIATVLLQVGILSVTTICLFCVYLPIFQIPKYFYRLTLALLLFLSFPLLYVILDQNPITWMLLFIFSSTSKIMLFVYWAMCLFMSAIIIMYLIFSNTQATTSTRKYFHLLIVFVYVPGIVYEPLLLYLASGAIMALFVFLELMRFLRVPPTGEILQQGFSALVDDKDSTISLTPLYLLTGLSFPLWMPTNNVPLIALLSGVLTIGIGDTSASFIGSRWGIHKWPGSEKSVEGTLACILSQVGVISFLVYLGYVDSGWLFLRSLLASIAVSFIEARTNQIDNLALPLLMYACLIT